MLCVMLIIVWYRKQFPDYFRPVAPVVAKESQVVNSVTSPVYSTNAWGLREEHSADSQWRTTNAVNEFIERARRAGLRLPEVSRLTTKVLAGKGTVAYAYNDGVHFGVHFSATDPAAVHAMHLKGVDANGVPKDFNAVVSSGDVNMNHLAAWASPDAYPLRTSPEDAKEKVVALLQQLEAGGTDRYVLERVIRIQKGVYATPFYNFQFTTREFLGQDWQGNRDEISIVVRLGGNDLLSGEAELVRFEDAGYLWRKLAADPEKAKRPLPHVKSL